MIVLAWRNVIRNSRRSAITIVAVALGLTALLFLWGFNDGVHNSMMRNLQQVIVGSIQIHRDGFFKSPKLSRNIDKPNIIYHALQQLPPLAVSWRLRSFALAAGDNSSSGLVLLGVDPQQERTTTRIADKVQSGHFFQSFDSASCVLGRTTAHNLGLTVGDTLVLLAQDRFGALSAEKVKLIGIIDSGEMGIDRGLALVPLAFMQTMLGMEDRYSEIVIQTSRQQLEAITTLLRQQLEPHGYEVLRWYDMYPMMQQWVQLENAFYYIFLGIVLLIVAAGVTNTVLMSMLERIREFGVMLAIGCSHSQLAAMVVIETLILAVIGVALGTAIGLALVTWFYHVGIDLASQMETIQRFYIDTVIHTEVDRDHLQDSVVAVLLAAISAVIIPLWRLFHLHPVEAIRHG